MNAPLQIEGSLTLKYIIIATFSAVNKKESPEFIGIVGSFTNKK
jgi:hypothetical protein